MSAHQHNPNQKFRPYFSGVELEEIITLFKEHPSPRRMGIIRYLETFLLKINHGMINVAHETKMTNVQKLGFDPAMESLPSKSEVMHSAWIKVTTNPSAATPREIELCMDYKYLNKLMSSEEEKEYERAMGLIL